MSNKPNGTNGTGNGHDKGQDKNIVSFPDKSERKRLKKSEEDQRQKISRAEKKHKRK